MLKPLIFSSALLISSSALLLILAGSSLADGTLRDAIGARTTGRGGVNLGFSDNGQMIIDNPAAIVNMSSMRLRDFGFDLLMTDLDYSDPDNLSAPAQDNPVPLGQFSMARKSANSDLGFGFGVFSQGGVSGEFEMNGPFPFSGRQNYQTFGGLVRVLPALSYRVTNRLSIGGNLGVAVKHMELEGPYTLQGPSPFAGTPTRLDLQGTGAALSWATGLQYLLTPQTTLGLNYQGETSFSLDGNTVIAVPGLGSARFDSTLDVTMPQSLGLGLQHALNPRTRVGFDLIWTDWSSAFDSFDITLQDPANPVFAAVLGNQIEEEFPLRWRDTVSVKLGAERDLASGSVLRAGYVYHRNPIPDTTLTPFLPTTLQHAFSVGYGWKSIFGEIDLAYQYSYSGERSVGTSAFIGGDFDNATHRAQAHWLSISCIQRF